MNVFVSDKTSILILLKILWRHLTLRRKNQLKISLLLMIASGFCEILCVSSVLPFLTVISSTKDNADIPYVYETLDFFGIDNYGNALFIITLTFVLLNILAGLIRVFNVWFNGILAASIGSDLSLKAYRKTLFQEYEIHLSQNTSKLIASFSKEINVVSFLIISPIIQLFCSLIIGFCIVITLIVIDPIATISTCLIISILYSIAVLTSRKPMRKISLSLVNLQKELVKILQEGLGAIRNVILDNNQKEYLEDYALTDRSLRKVEANGNFLNYYPKLLVEALGISTIAILGYLLKTKVGDNSALPTLGALALGSIRLLPTAQRVYEGWSMPQNGKNSLVNIINLLEQKIPTRYKTKNIEAYKLRDKIKFSNVSFGYDINSPKVLKNISFEILKGQKIGIVGTTGSGKSTLLDLMMGLLRPTSGEIFIDGKDINDQNKPERLLSWQASLVHVPQSIFLSDRSILENIAFGVPKDKIDYERLKLVALQANILEFIESSPSGFHTIVGERGVRLSGGQRQRIGIARALYKKADFIVLDEATSALDNQTEGLIMENLIKNNSELTIVMIAHRLDSLKFCDLLISLEKGKIISLSKNK